LDAKPSRLQRAPVGTLCLGNDEGSHQGRRASPPQEGGGEACTASPRPVKEPVDRKTLRDKIFKRFDKVIARLAE
jgi:hypothetical protein